MNGPSSLVRCMKTCQHALTPLPSHLDHLFPLAAMQEVVLTSHYLGLVMEYAPGGSLTQYVTRKWKETG